MSKHNSIAGALGASQAAVFLLLLIMSQVLPGITWLNHFALRPIYKNEINVKTYLLWENQV